jgi:uncharacterized protein (DUF2147 family)
MARWSRKLEAAALAAAIAAPNPAAADGSVVGEWITPARSARVAIAPCPRDPALLCGRIAWLAQPMDADGAPLSDRKNPDPALRSRPLVGVEIIHGFRAGDPGHWRGGKIYDPESGRTYDARLRLAAPDTLEVKGCVLVFCEAQTWRRASDRARR